MSAMQILQNIKASTERQLARLTSGSTRLYEITTAGAISERTAAMRDYYTDVSRQIQSVIDQLQ
jgi:hypothetical protein